MMNRALLPRRLVAVFLIAVTAPTHARGDGDGGSHVTINADRVLVVDGHKVFPIGFTLPPPPDGKTPTGKDGIAELHDAGASFLRTGVMLGPWDDAAIAHEQRWQDAAARNGMHCWVFLRELGSLAPGDAATEAMLRKVVNRFKNHPGMGVWKGVDEPEWGKSPVPPLVRAYQLIHALDPDHPIAVTHAPRGTVASLRLYNAAADITGADIYPVGYPPGAHSLRENREISMVGDFTRTMMEVAGTEKPVWMILQIAWSGVVKPGKTLRFPTLAQERFMAYQAVINGARGLVFFGGHLTPAMTPEDAAIGWNWTFWNRVLRPVVAELGEKSSLQPALVAADSPLRVKVTGAPDVEFCVREADGALYLLACKREGATVQVRFDGLPSWAAGGEVLFESPRRVEARAGSFSDWFGPFEVHVYRFRHGTPGS
jgi:hypothetical protein